MSGPRQGRPGTAGAGQGASPAGTAARVGRQGCAGRFGRDEAGSLLIEVALGLPFILLLIFLMFDGALAVAADALFEQSLDGADQILADGGSNQDVANYIATQVGRLADVPAGTVTVSSSGGGNNVATASLMWHWKVGLVARLIPPLTFHGDLEGVSQ